jgi:simple sugar transport system ATP-binding protein
MGAGPLLVGGSIFVGRQQTRDPRSLQSLRARGNVRPSNKVAAFAQMTTAARRRPGGSLADATAAGSPLVEVVDLEKRFGGVRALNGATLTIFEGETLALVGDNGAGKSTLVKALSGVQPPDGGEIRLRGTPVTIASTREAGRLGIEVVYQDLALANSLDVPSNVFLGDELTMTKWGWFSIPNDRRMLEETEATLARLRITIPDPRRPVGTLSGGQRQAVAIGRAIRKPAIELLVLDEPTAALGVEEVKKVLGLIGTLRSQGQTMLVISHDLEHVFQVSDRIAVMRSGRVQGVVRTAEVTKTDIVRLIVGDIGTGLGGEVAA